jgi:hypothetical protein
MLVASSRDVQLYRRNIVEDLNEQLTRMAATNAQLMDRLKEVEGALMVIKNLSQPKVEVIKQSDIVDVTEFKVSAPPTQKAKK